MTRPLNPGYLVGGLVVLLCSSLAWAVLPPKAAKQRRQRIYSGAKTLQKRAPEVLRIRVTSVTVKRIRTKRRNCLKEQRFVVKARILGVTRSRAGLRRGHAVTFRYGQRYQCQCGPRMYNPAALVKGDVATVYLKRQRKPRPLPVRFRIAASVLSVVKHTRP